ncbi:MAG: serine hydrolase domain-containing protein [Myxococcota bacterium]
MAVEIHGHCDERFGRVRESFAENFREFHEVGASVAITVDGASVVDLWAGHADEARTRPWERDTIVNVASTTKGMTALCAHMLADRGELDFDAPVARYWPEFAQAGKESLPVRYLLTHQAGLATIEKELPTDAMLDWGFMVRALAEQAPSWEPGKKQGYHGLTFGWLVGEVIRRISGRSVGTFLREEVTRPLGVDFLIGFGPEEDHRVAETIHAPADRPASAAARGRASPAGWPRNARDYRAAEIPAANGHTNARALARIYGALARGGEIDGVRLLRPESVERAAVEEANGIDETLGVPTHRTLGFMLRFAEFGDVRRASAFGHAGAGGSQGFADPASKLGFGYAMNRRLSPTAGETRPPTGGMDPRGQRLVEAAYGCQEDRA